MHKRILALLLSSVLAFSVVGCSPKEEEKEATNTSGSISTITVDELDPSSMQVVDIRGEEQFIGWNTEDGKGGHIKGAADFPETWLDMDLSKDSAIGTEMKLELERRHLDTSKKTVLYSNDTVSEEDAKKYQELGFTDLSILEGGYNSYVEAKKETASLPKYSMYVHPQWVQDLIDGKNPETYNGNDFKIVEMSLGSEEGEYEGGHIKGAINVKDTFNHLPGLRALAEYDAVPLEEQLKFWNRNSDDVIKKDLENLGITKDTTVVLYATTPATTAAARAALIMKYAGVKDIRILNGGKTLWKLQGRELEEGTNTPEKVDFGAEVPQNPDVIYDYDEELKVVENPDKAVVASIRSWDEYTCKVSGYTYIGEAGDIANSRFGYAGSDPYSMEDFRNVDNTMFNYELMEERWNKWGITPDKEVSFHCGTGWRASETYFYAEAMGWEDIHVYDGGWYEWHKVKGSPKKEKGLPEDAPEEKPEEYFVVKEK